MFESLLLLGAALIWDNAKTKRKNKEIMQELHNNGYFEHKAKYEREQRELKDPNYDYVLQSLYYGHWIDFYRKCRYKPTETNKRHLEIYDKNYHLILDENNRVIWEESGPRVIPKAERLRMCIEAYEKETPYKWNPSWVKDYK